MNTTTLRQYDVWQCYINGRTSYRALLHLSEQPTCAVRHLDTITATSKRDATTRVIVERRMRWKELER